MAENAYCLYWHNALIITELNNHTRYFNVAYNQALLSEGVRSNRFRLGAVLAYKGQILKAKPNCQRTHAKLNRIYKWPFLHAEANVILSLGMDNCEGLNLYVLRILKNNHIALAKPCDDCQKLIDYVGIKHIYYTTNDGWEEL